MIAVAILIAFLLGSLPFSWLLVRFLRGIDLREVGSGNPGATNAWRVVGPGWGSVALFLDIGKGAAAVLASPLLLGSEGGPDWLPAACGCAAILGNVFCPFLGFKGGKAVATASGVFLGLAPLAFGLTLLAFLLVVAVTRRVSIGSLVGAVVLPSVLTSQLLFEWTRPPHLSVVLLVWLAALVVIVRHLSNIRRLLQGAESTFSERIDSHADSQQ
jgi:glycerol-3-phosphate acyltransferase PlsY